MKNRSISLVLFSLFISFWSTTSVFAQTSCPAENTPPPEVKDVKAVSDSAGEVKLTWDQAESSNDVVIDYKLYYGKSPVVTADDFYDKEIRLGQGPASSYTLSGLENGTYYFSITAIDSSDCESLNYSIETSATVGETEKAVEPEKESVPAEEPSATEKSEADLIAEKKEDDSFLKTTNGFNFDGGLNFIGESVTEESPEKKEETVLPEETSTTILDLPEAQAAESVDVTPPMNPKNLEISKKNFPETGEILLSWGIPTDVDLADQILYTKKGTNAWDSGYSIGKDIGSIRVSAEKNKSYLYKITAVDSTGNESSGVRAAVNTEIKPLAKSGGSIEFLLLGLAVFIFFGILFRLKKNRA